MVDRTEDSQAFLEEVIKYIGPDVGQFNYEDMVRSFPDKARFYDLVDQLSRLRSPRGATVLSSGCGFAGAAFAWAEAGAARVWGVEVDARMARIGGIRLVRWPNAHVLTYNGQSLPFPGDAFDMIDSIHVVEHVHDVKAYLDDLLRVLKPGGLCYLECPNRLFPVELHTTIPCVHWLPKNMGDRLGKVVARFRFWPRHLCDRFQVLDTMTFRYLTPWNLCRLLSRRGAQAHFLEPRHRVLRVLARCGVPGSILPTMVIRLVFVK